MILVNKGIKNKTSKMKRFETLQTLNAQNIYEGLSYIRNENFISGNMHTGFLNNFNFIEE